MLFYCCATAKVQMASFECHFCSFFVFLPKHFLPKVSAVYCCIMWWIFFFLEELIVFEMHDRHLIVSVFFGAVVNWIEDKRHTSLVAALSFRRSCEPGETTTRGDILYPSRFYLFFFFFLFTLYLSRSFSLIRFSFSSIQSHYFCPQTISHSGLSSPSLVFLLLSLLLEDTRCKQSSSQRHTLHTISLAFKGVEYSQLCWKLNSLKPPFPLQQFIVGEFSVFAERLGLSRGWCQRAPIVPCSTAVSPTTTTSPHPHRLLLRLPTTFPFFFSWHSFCDREENFGALFHKIFLTFLVYGWFIRLCRRSSKRCLCSKTQTGDRAMSTAVTDYTYQSSFPTPSTCLHMPKLDDKTS